MIDRQLKLRRHRRDLFLNILSLDNKQRVNKVRWGQRSLTKHIAKLLSAAHIYLWGDGLIMRGVLLDNVLLEPLADACVAERRYEFMLMALPLKIPQATGGPINPIAMF